jgi:hypothetical protein
MIEQVVCSRVRYLFLSLTVLLCAGLRLELCAAEHARIRIRAHQPGVTEPVAVRAVIERSDGEIVPGEWGDSNWPPVAIRGKAMTPDMTVEVPVGQTRLTLAKGPDYFPLTIVTNLAEPNRTYTIEASLQPVFDLYQKGWRAGDAHIHFYHGDGQVFRGPEEAYAICAAGGLNFASLAGEHFGAPTLNQDQSRRVWKPYEATDCRIWLGAESPKNAWGHHAAILYDPWSVRDSLPYHHGLYEVHRQGGVVFPVHPDRVFPFRDFAGERSLFPLNNHYKYYPIAALAGHLIDGWSGISDEPANANMLPPYFALLRLGYKIPLLADSDFCMDRANNGLKGVGFWLNYLQLEGHEVTPAAVATAIRKGRVMSTSGPLVLFSIDDASSGDILPADGRERTVRIQASHTFNPWTLGTRTFSQAAECKIDRIDLFRNAEVLRSWTPDAPTADLSLTIAESDEAQYMVRVLGNEGVWMAGYASPIYFTRQPDAERQPEVFKMLVNGRLYDAATGNSLTGTVSSVRYGRVDWTIGTDEQGRFRARVPIDAELVARDANGRNFSRNLFHDEAAYAFCHYLPERFTNKAEAIEPFRELIREVTWEFPLGFQLADSYVRRELSGDFSIEDVVVLSAPERWPDKKSSELAMLFTDKTQVQPGDILNFAVLIRAPQSGKVGENISIGCYAWDPRQPRVYTRYGTLLEARERTGLMDFGDGFYLLKSSVLVPEWAANSTRTTGGLRISAAVRQGFSALEDVNLIVPVGPTRRELLVSTTWDGMPATWGDSGHGPCGFFRESFQARYPDYRTMAVRLKVGGLRIRVEPKHDTAHHPDADDAVFTDHFYYDGQCEPEYRNVAFRDRVRSQPEETDFSSVPLQDPPDETAPDIALMEPLERAEVTSPVSFYFHVEDAGLSGAGRATLLVNSEAVAESHEMGPSQLELPPGEYRWQIEALDRAGNSARSDQRTFTVIDPAHNYSEPLLELSPSTATQLNLLLTVRPNQNYFLETTTDLLDWRVFLRTNAASQTISISDPLTTNAVKIYRIQGR